MSHLNAFQGAIKSHEINYTFLELHIIDLSQNSFFGNLPIKYFLHWNAMKVVGANQLKYMEVNSRGGSFGSVQCTMHNYKQRHNVKVWENPRCV
jgi:hypothetical protein